jgi:hypothetical protein
MYIISGKKNPVFLNTGSPGHNLLSLFYNNFLRYYITSIYCLYQIYTLRQVIKGILFCSRFT